MLIVTGETRISRGLQGFCGSVGTEEEAGLKPTSLVPHSPSEAQESPYKEAAWGRPQRQELRQSGRDQPQSIPPGP